MLTIIINDVYLLHFTMASKEFTEFYFPAALVQRQ